MNYGWHVVDDSIRSILLDRIITNTPGDGPWHLEIQPSNKCNANCVFCNTQHFRKQEILPWDILKPVLESKAGGNLSHVRLVGGGEPLIYPQMTELLNMLGQINLKGFDVITNGILLEKYAQGLLENGCDEIFVSLNELTPELYAQTMRVSGKNFQRVMTGIKTAVKQRDLLKRRGKCKITVQIFLHDQNLGYLEDVAQNLRGIGVDQIDLRTAYDTHTSPDDRNKLTSSFEKKAFEVIKKEILKDHSTGRRIISISLLDVGNMELNHHLNKFLEQVYGSDSEGPLIDPSRERDEYCFAPWYTATIGATGQISACCNLSSYPVFSLGNLHRESFSQIWSGENFQALRKQLRQVMVTKGNLTYSRKRHPQIMKKCIDRYSCYLTFGLADRSFYEQLGAKLDKHINPLTKWKESTEEKTFRVLKKIRNKIRSY